MISILLLIVIGSIVTGILVEFGGWRRIWKNLLADYAVYQIPEVTKIGWTELRGKKRKPNRRVYVSFNEEGLYLDPYSLPRKKKPRAFIPWEEITKVETRDLLIEQRIFICFGAQGKYKLRLSSDAFDKIEPKVLSALKRNDLLT